MKIHLRQIPEGGTHLEGQEDCPLGELEKDEIRCAGPLSYSLDVGVSEGALWANGSLAQPVELTCVSWLRRFVYTIEVSAFALHMELGGPELLDVTPALREDLLLNLPPYPHCDRDGSLICPAAESIKNPEEEQAAGEKKRKADWSALDDLQLLAPLSALCRAASLCRTER